MHFPEKFARRLAMSVFGVFFCSMAIGMFRHSGFGVDPFQCFAMGIWEKFFPQLSYGLFWSAISLLFMGFDLWYDRRTMGLATLINLLLAGYIVDASETVMKLLFPAPALSMRIALLCVGLVICCFGASLYMTADFGVSVYDALAVSISKKHSFPFRLCRIATDLVCVGIGALCGLMPGIGTIVTALCMGPLVDFFNRTVSTPMLRFTHKRSRVKMA